MCVCMCVSVSVCAVMYVCVCETCSLTLLCLFSQLSQHQRAMSSTALPLETKLLLELTRGAALAVHAAAGSARGHRAARFLRAAEGLCRSAAALPQEPADAKTSKGKAKDCDKHSTPR